MILGVKFGCDIDEDGIIIGFQCGKFERLARSAKARSL